MQLLLLMTMEERELVTVAHSYVCCLWDENSGCPWMVYSSAIEKKTIVVKMVLKNGKEGESSPALAAASLESVGDDIGGSSSLLCLWAKIYMVPWTVHSNVIKKINLAEAKRVSKRETRGNSHWHSW